MYSLCGDGHCNVYASNGLILFDLGGPMKEAGNGIRADCAGEAFRFPML